MTSNHTHILTEVLCAIWFDPQENIWDSTYFGKFFAEIEKLGFAEKQEQKPFQIKMEMNSEKAPSTEMSEGESRMLFSNKGDQTAIVLSNNYISFHKLPDYISWENLIANVVKPGLEKYRGIGLGKGEIQVQALYLNKYVIPKTEKLNKYFTFLPSVDDFGIGVENNLVFQSQYDLDPNLHVLIRLNGGLSIDETNRELFLEISTFAKKTGSQNWEDLAKQAHDQTNLVYNRLIKTK